MFNAMTPLRVGHRARRWGLSLLLAFLLLLIPLIASADAALTQSFSAQGNYAIVAAGIGLFESTSGDISLNVPGTPIQAFLYWAGNDFDPGGDDAISFAVNAGPSTPRTADRVFGPDFWFSSCCGDVFNYVYAEDVTAQVLSGTNTYTISDFGPIRHHYGAGLIVVYEDLGLPVSQTTINDGLDSAFWNFAPPRGPNTEVTCFTFAATATSRDLDFVLLGGGVATNVLRPNAIWYQTGTGGQPSDLVNQPGATEIGGQPLNSNDGDEFDTYTNTITVPAGDTFACFQVESISDQVESGASFVWIAASARIQTAVASPTPTPVPTSGPPSADGELPDTGFAPGRTTLLPVQPADRAYTHLEGLTVEIPKLGVELPITGVPQLADGWDVTWLSKHAGYLEGTAFPTWSGNTALTAHVSLADGTPGPFARLDELRWGDEIVVSAFGQRYVYEVQRVRYVKPDDLSVLGHEDYDWVTLITCRLYDPEQDSYLWRVAVQAVLIRVEDF